MLQRREFCAAESMVDVFDRAATLNFTVVARLSGPLSETALVAALRKLELRHPLLRARIERHAKGAAFVMGEAQPIAVHVIDGEVSDWKHLSESSLVHRVWPDEGPRAEVTWIRHADQHSTLLLTMHHLVGDGRSGFVALRDLLGFLAEPTSDPSTIASPGQQAFYPAKHGTLTWRLRALKLIAGAMFAPKPRRLRTEPKERDVRRVPRLAVLTFGREQTQELMHRARAADASLHGVVFAALVKGVVEAGGWKSAPLRLCHPVDLHSYLRSVFPGSPLPGDAVGYYVSSLETDHVVTTHTGLVDLAREITRAVRAKKKALEPLLTAPIAGPWLTRPFVAQRDLSRFGELAERYVLLDSLGVTNLGALESFGLQTEVGALTVEDAFVVSGASLITTITTAATSFRGKLTLVLQWTEPFVSSSAAERVLARAGRELGDFAAREVEMQRAAEPA